MTARLFRGDAPASAIDPLHRGIAYGDGLFETMRAHAGEVPWWARHWARLVDGAERLKIALPAEALVREQIASMADATDSLLGDGAVLKLIVSRGPGGRGYAPMDGAQPDWQLTLHPPPPPPRPGGLWLRWCALRLALQPVLAGLKHCNRLEQVLARAEWNDTDIDEGLLRNAAGRVVSATTANLFVLRDGRWHTPRLDECGVAGICRGWALAALDAAECALSPQDIETADAIFLCNAVRGILPVARLGARHWAPHPAVSAARRLLAADHPAFPCPESA